MMFWYVAILILELTALFFISRQFTQQVYLSWYLVFRRRSIAVSAISLILFPGTVVHELSHLFTAEILGVHTGTLTLVPEGIEEESIQSGSVAIAVTDPFRRAIIGLAPLFTGMIILSVLAYFLPPWYASMIFSIQQNKMFDFSVLRFLSSVYCIFALSTTMFSSPEDMKGFFPLIGALTIVVGGLYLAGLRFSLTEPVLSIVTNGLITLVQSLGLVLVVNIGGLLISSLIISFLRTILHK